MTIMRFSHRLMFAAGLTLSVSVPVLAQDSSMSFDDGFAYRHVYDTSQSLFDACGAPELGALYRQVIRDKVEQCGLFSDRTKADFRDWAATRTIAIEDEDRKARAKGPVPAPDHAKFCSELSGQAEIRFIRGKLAAYGRGQANADDVLAEPCAHMTQ